MGHGTPSWELLLIRFAFPALRAAMRRGMRIHAAGEARSRAKVEEVFDAVNARLSDGRRYLVGDQLTAADLTFAALAVPIARPPEFPIPIPTVDRFPEVARAFVEQLAASPAGLYAARMYREHRRPTES
jgi:glutathione S-transferase